MSKSVEGHINCTHPTLRPKEDWILRGPRSSSLWVSRNLSHHMTRQDRTGDTVLVTNIYIEYHSVCPASELGPTHPLSRKRMFGMCPSPPDQRGGRHTLFCRRGSGGVPIPTIRENLHDSSRLADDGRSSMYLASLSSPTPQFPSCHLSDFNNCNQEEGNCRLAKGRKDDMGWKMNLHRGTRACVVSWILRLVPL